MNFDVDAATEALRAAFAEWVQALDLSVQSVEPGRVVLHMPITPDIARIGGIVSGQSLAAAADTAMVLAVGAEAGAFEPVATTDLHMQFLRPGLGDHIEVGAEVVRAGRSLVFTKADLVSFPSGKLCATATATMAR